MVKVSHQSDTHHAEQLLTLPNAEFDSDQQALRWRLNIIEYILNDPESSRSSGRTLRSPSVISMSLSAADTVETYETPMTVSAFHLDSTVEAAFH